MSQLVSMEKIRRNMPLGFLDSLPAIQGPLNRSLETLLGIRQIDAHIRRVAHLRNHDFVHGLMRDLGLVYDCPPEHEARVPKTGRVVVAANHPTGISELGMFDYLGCLRRDVKIVINETLLDIAANARDIVIPLPVFNRRDPKVQARLRGQIREALEDEMMVLFFPSGVISNRLPGGGIQDPEWKKGAFHAARDTESPVLPAHIGARNSEWFYRIRSLGKVGETLSWTLLFREYLGHQDGTYPIRFGELIQPDDMRPGENLSSEEMGEIAEMARQAAYSLAA